MKTWAQLVLLLVSALPLLGGEPSAAPRAVPQPRVRLQPSAQGAGAQLESGRAVPKAVTMDKMVVAETKLPTEPLTAPEPERTRFSPLHGGPIFSGKIGTLPVSVGLWPWVDVLAKDSRFKSQKTRVDLEVVRISF